MSNLPIIDFSPFLDPLSSPEAKKSTALQIDQACRDVGFFYLSHHGVDDVLMEKMLLVAKWFFESATTDEKQRMALKNAGSGGGDNARGWQFIEGRGKGAHEVCLKHHGGIRIKQLEGSGLLPTCGKPWPTL